MDGGWSIILDFLGQIYPILSLQHHKSSSVEARIATFGPVVQNTLVKIIIVFGIDWCWSSCQCWILKPYFSTKLLCTVFVLYLLRPFLLILVRPSLATDQICLLWQNGSFYGNHWWPFQSIIDIAIDLFIWEDQYFLWITAAPLFTMATIFGNWNAHISVTIVSRLIT